MKNLVLVLTLAALLVAPAAASAASTPAPAFTLPTIAGSSISLAGLSGKAVYLDFFASWCPPCNAEAPAVSALAKQYASSGLTVVAIDENENAAAAAAFAKKYGFSFSVALDNSGSVGDEYAVDAIPVSVFIDRNGTVREIETGELSSAQIQAGIRSILGTGTV
jgi:thiol-disulfide isomerase/thioredoxin